MACQGERVDALPKAVGWGGSLSFSEAAVRLWYASLYLVPIHLLTRGVVCRATAC